MLVVQVRKHLHVITFGGLLDRPVVCQVAGRPYLGTLESAVAVEAPPESKKQRRLPRGVLAKHNRHVLGTGGSKVDDRLPVELAEVVNLKAAEDHLLCTRLLSLSRRPFL